MPKLEDDPWPDQVRSRFKNRSGRNCLSPLRMLAHITEMMRLGQNQHALLAHSFDHNYKELNVRPYLNNLSHIGTTKALPGLDGLVEATVFGTSIMLPPHHAWPANAGAGKQWSDSMFDMLVAQLFNSGQMFFNPYVRPKIDEVRKALALHITSHPRYWPQKSEGKPPSIPRGNPAEYWGMNWRMHAAVGLLELSKEAYDWNVHHRDKQDRLLSWAHGKPSRSLEKAIGAMIFFWLESFHPAALASGLQPILTAKMRDIENRNSLRAAVGPIKLTPDECLLDNIADGANFGSTVVDKAMDLFAKRPARKKMGHSSRYLAQLQLDDKGTDAPQYHLYQRKTVRSYKATIGQNVGSDQRLVDQLQSLGLTVTNASPAQLCPIKMSRMATTCAVDLAMMVSPFALDPMHYVNLQKRRLIRMPAQTKSGPQPPKSS